MPNITKIPDSKANHIDFNGIITSISFYLQSIVKNLLMTSVCEIRIKSRNQNKGRTEDFAPTNQYEHR